MIKTKHLLILPFALFLFLNNKCEKKREIIQNKLPFTVSEAYCQKTIPGQRGFKPFLEVHITIQNQENIYFDSIYFRGETLPISTYKKANGTHLISKKEETIKKKKNSSFKEEKKIKNNQLIIISTKENKKNYYFIDSIVERETIYLP